jgi:membrane fusion protein (multidrug efflux system)
MAALTACSLAGEESSQAVQSPPVPVGVIEAQLTPVNLGESFVRRIEAVQKVEVRARVTGFIEARLFEEGQFVEVGVPLFHIEKDTYEAVVRQRQADLAAAEAESVNARAQLDRAEALAKGGNIAQEALEERRAAAQTTAAAILQARAALRQAEIALGYTDIHAPLSGLIGRAAYDVGDLVGPDSGPLTEIISRDPIYAVFPISQRELVAAERQAAEHGQDRSAFVVRIRFADGSEYPHPGKVDFVGINQWC